MNRGASSPSASEPRPSRRADRTKKPSISAEATATAIRASTPSAAHAAANAAPAIPPNAQPACSEDMIGRPRFFSTPTPWLFIDTSIVALEAPSTNRPSTSTSGFGSSTARLTASVVAMPPIQIMRTVPCFTTAWPATGKASTTASDMPRITSPIMLLDRSNRSWIHGICATQVPIAAPLTKKTPVVAQRGVMRGSP